MSNARQLAEFGTASTNKDSSIYSLLKRTVPQFQDKSTTTRSTGDMELLSWKLLGAVNTGNPASGGLQYIHIMTDLNSSGMYFFKVEGYGYSYGNMISYHGCYYYTSTQVLNKFTSSMPGTSMVWYDSYISNAANGYKLVLILNLGATSYTEGLARIWLQNNSFSDGLASNNIVSIARTASVSAQF